MYELDNDQDEFVNLADRPELAAVQQRLLDELDRWRRATNDPLLDGDKLAMLAAEDRERVELMRREGRTNAPPWRYPSYLYGADESDGHRLPPRR